MLVTGCTPDTTPTPVDPGDSPSQAVGGCYVVNEGGFNYGNAMVGFWQKAMGTYKADLFRQANQRALGDVLQHMYIRGDTAMLVLNNSGRVELVDVEDFRSLGAIVGLVSPRYIQPLTGTKAYVTDLYNQGITIVDLATRQRTGKIPLPGWTEELAYTRGRVYVTNRYADYLYVIDPTVDRIIDSLFIGYGGGAIEVDKMGQLWIFGAGDPLAGKSGGIYRVNPQNREVRSFIFPGNADVFPRLAMNAGKDTLYYLQGGVYALPITANTLPAQPLIPAQRRTFYGLAVNPANSHIFVTDAKDYLQRGDLWEYTPQGEPLQSIQVGIIPSDVIFY